MTWRPTSAALAWTVSWSHPLPASEYSLKLTAGMSRSASERPDCLAAVTGNLPINYTPHFTNKFPLVQVFRIVNPTNYARTVFVEKLQTAGVSVDAPAVTQNAASLLPARNSYAPTCAGREAQRHAVLGLREVHPEGELQHRRRHQPGAVRPDAESRQHDGRAGGRAEKSGFELRSARRAVSLCRWQRRRTFHGDHGCGDADADGAEQRPTFPCLLNALPNMGIDGSLGFVNQFESDPTLAGAKGHVRAKPGTYRRRLGRRD